MGRDKEARLRWFGPCVEEKQWIYWAKKLGNGTVGQWGITKSPRRIHGRSKRGHKGSWCNSRESRG